MGIEPIRFEAEPTGDGGYAVPALDLLRSGLWVARLDLLVDDFTKVTLRTEIPVD